MATIDTARDIARDTISRALFRLEKSISDPSLDWRDCHTVACNAVAAALEAGWTTHSEALDDTAMVLLLTGQRAEWLAHHDPQEG